jgi:ubiquinone/menaquinone biosynthesis C-methylase UbiE
LGHFLDIIGRHGELVISPSIRVNTPAIYTPGHSEAVTAFMARRSAATHAGFVLPHIRPDARILDLGCGPGTITLDLAARVSRGSVLGVDLHPGQVNQARERAQERGVTNVVFEVGSVESVTLPARSFDVVFAHALFEHLTAPVDVLRRVSTFLRPGGLMAMRSPDWGGFVVHPDADGLEPALEAYEQLQKCNGGDLRAGRKLGAWLEAAGFDDVVRSASYQIYEDTKLIATYLASQLEAAGQVEPGKVLRTWAALPGAMFAQAWFEAIGRKPLG